MNIVKLDQPYHRPRQVRGREIWDQKEPSSEMVWEICPYLRMHLDEGRCNQCPRDYEEPNHGPAHHGCYILAVEVCRIIFAMQKRECR